MNFDWILPKLSFFNHGSSLTSVATFLFFLTLHQYLWSFICLKSNILPFEKDYSLIVYILKVIIVKRQSFKNLVIDSLQKKLQVYIITGNNIFFWYFVILTIFIDNECSFLCFFLFWYLPTFTTFFWVTFPHDDKCWWAFDASIEWGM